MKGANIQHDVRIDRLRGILLDAVYVCCHWNVLSIHWRQAEDRWGKEWHMIIVCRKSFNSNLFISTRAYFEILYFHILKEYLFGDRNQNPMLVAVSLMASFMSSISILGGDAEVFNYGTHFYTINIGCQIGILIAMECYVPVFLKLESVSMYQVSNQFRGKAE